MPSTDSEDRKVFSSVKPAKRFTSKNEICIESEYVDDITIMRCRNFIHEDMDARF